MKEMIDYIRKHISFNMIDKKTIRINLDPEVKFGKYLEYGVRYNAT